VDFDRLPFLGERFGGDRLRVQVDRRLQLLQGGTWIAGEVAAREREPRLGIGRLQPHRPLQRRARQ